MRLPGGTVIKNPLANAGETGLFPGSRKYPGVGNGNPRYSCLENSMDKGACRARVGVAKSQTWLSERTHTYANTHT